MMEDVPRPTSDKPADKRIFLRADKTVSYDDLMKVMNLLQASGHSRMALVGLSVPAGNTAP
jgi:biopolymer transport protein ExbD